MPAVAASQLILFQLADLTYAFDVTAVQEILPEVKARKIPRSANFIEGVFDFRGRIIPLINLKRLLAINDDIKSSNVVVIGVEGQILGLMVDRVLEVSIKQELDIKPIKTEAKGEYLRGQISYGDNFAGLLDLELLATIVSNAKEA